MGSFSEQGEILPESEEEDDAGQQEPERQKSEGMSQLLLCISARNQIQDPGKED